MGQQYDQFQPITQEVMWFSATTDSVFSGKSKVNMMCKSTDGGRSWRCDSLPFVGKDIYAFSFFDTAHGIAVANSSAGATIYRYFPGSTGVAESQSMTFGATLHPNPATSFVSIDLPTNAKESTVTVFDDLGKEVHALVRQRAAGHVELDISELPEGTYFIQIGTGEKMERLSFVKVAR